MKSALRAFKNEWNEYCEGECIVRELTSNDDVKPTVDKLKRLIYLISAEPEYYQRTTFMIMKRVVDVRYLRHTEKGLIVVEYLIKYADRCFALTCKTYLTHFQKLRRYQYRLNEREYGGNVRKLAARIVQLLENDEKLDTVRAQAQGLPKPNLSKPKKPRKMVSSVNMFSNKDHTKSLNAKQAKKQEQKEKEEIKKPKEQLMPSEDLLGDVVFTSKKATVLSDDWLEEFALNAKENGGVGEDGGIFEFKAFEDNNLDNDENANEIPTEDDVETPDAWINKLTQMDNPLQEVEKKEKN